MSRDKDRKTAADFQRTFTDNLNRKIAEAAAPVEQVSPSKLAPSSRQLLNMTTSLDKFVERKKACVAADDPSSATRRKHCLCTVWASGFVVGDLDLPHAATVGCFDDRLEYKICGHPDEGTVYMYMSFKHMADARLDVERKEFSFRIEKDLR